ncbi:MAG: peptide deformylase [Planctomycetota bacterium]
MHIVYYPDPVLLRPAATVETVPENIDEILAGMREVMELERGIGLAAPQVGLSLKIILVGQTDDDGPEERVLLNPRIIRFDGKKEWGEEGCLSFPGIYGEVLRHTEIEVAYTDLEGREQTMVATDFLARVLQHEIDHLEGRIFVEKMRPADKIVNRQRLQELVERFEATRT